MSDLRTTQQSEHLPLRILVCGGRGFNHRQAVTVVLSCVPPGQHTLVHGDCSGADRVAASVGRHLGWDIEPHPAAWSAPCRPRTCTPGHRRTHPDGSPYCPAAGDYRNREMVDLGADILIVFPGGDGTRNMVEMTDAADIPVWDPFRMFHERFSVPWITLPHRVGLDEIAEEIPNNPHVSPQAIEDFIVRVAAPIHQVDPAWTSGLIGRLRQLPLPD